MSVEAFAELIRNFGQSIGLAEATPDADGYCAMSFDELVVHFQYDADDVVIFSRLGEVDEDRVEGIYGMLLAANMFWQGTKGGTISVEPDSRVAFIADRRPLAYTSDATFRDWLSGFIDIAEHWTDRLATANAGGPLLAGDDELPPQPLDPGAEFMTRV
jgi:hypothetical protein